MGNTTRTYRWCNGCERRIAEELFNAGRCPGCHDTIKRKLSKKEVTFTDEEYEAMYDLLPGRDEDY